MTASPAPPTTPGTAWQAARDEYSWTVVDSNGDLVARVPGSDAYAQGQAEYLAQAANCYAKEIRTIQRALYTAGFRPLPAAPGETP